MIRIRKYHKSDLEAVAALIWRVYQAYTYPNDLSKAAWTYMSEHYNPKKNEQLKRDFDHSPILYVATHSKKIVGVIKGTAHHLSQLHIAGSKQRQGIGSELVQRFERHAKKLGGSIVTLNASPGSIIFYQKLGYKKSTGMRRHRIGFMCQPMKKKLV